MRTSCVTNGAKDWCSGEAEEVCVGGISGVNTCYGEELKVSEGGSDEMDFIFVFVCLWSVVSKISKEKYVNLVAAALHKRRSEREWIRRGEETMTKCDVKWVAVCRMSSKASTIQETSGRWNNGMNDTCEGKVKYCWVVERTVLFLLIFFLVFFLFLLFLFCSGCCFVLLGLWRIF